MDFYPKSWIQHVLKEMWVENLCTKYIPKLFPTFRAVSLSPGSLRPSRSPARGGNQNHSGGPDAQKDEFGSCFFAETHSGAQSQDGDQDFQRSGASDLKFRPHSLVVQVMRKMSD